MPQTTLVKTQELRDTVIATIDHSERLLDKMRFGAYLTERERQGLWVLLSDTVYSLAKKHYRQAQTFGRKTGTRKREWYELPTPAQYTTDRATKGFDVHTERMLILVEWLKSRKDKSAGWCIVSYKRKFAQFEMVREFRSLGISISVADVQKREVRDAVLFESLARQAQVNPLDNFNTILMTWVENENEAGRKVSELRLRNFIRRFAHYESLLGRTKYAVQFEETKNQYGTN